MQFSNEFLARWEHIIDDVDITEVPLECIKKIIIKLGNKKQRTINLAILRKQGLTSDEIEYVMNRILVGYGDEVNNVDFIVDVALVATIVQPETDKLLDKLK
jgi:hypothetical protein